MSSLIQTTPPLPDGKLRDSHQKLRAVQNAARAQLDGALLDMFDAVSAKVDAGPAGAEEIEGLRAALTRRVRVTGLTYEHVERCWGDFAIGIAAGGAEAELPQGVARIAIKACDRHAAALGRLERRLALLQPGGMEAAANHPLIPSHLLHAFLAALQECGIDESSSRALAQEYERVVLARLGDICDVLSRLLVEQDVLANEPVPPVAIAEPQVFASETSESEAVTNNAKAQTAVEPTARRATSQEQAQAMLQRLVGNAVLPPFVSELLHGPLMRHLNQAYRRAGESGGAWREGCGFVAALIWSAQPHSNAEERHRVAETASELVDALPRLLAQLAMGEAEVTALQMRLRQFYEAILREPHAPVNATITAAGATDAQRPVDSSPVHDTTAGEGDAEPTKVTDLRVGSWVTLHVGNGAVRAKLSWIGANGHKFLFVDAHGAKLALLTHAQLVDALARRD